MDDLSQLEFGKLVENSSVLEESLHEPRVYLSPDNKVIKVFRPKKKLFTSNRVIPYALRFARNAKRLEQLGFNSVSVEKVGRCRELGLHFAVYPLLPGSTIRELEDHTEMKVQALSRLAGYLCELHLNGIYFKALHLGNVLVQSDGSFSLIDIHSTTFFSTPVSIDRRVKNFFNILRYVEDYALLEQYGFNKFFEEYMHCSQLNVSRRAILLNSLRGSHSFPELKTELFNSF